MKAWSFETPQYYLEAVEDLDIPGGARRPRLGVSAADGRSDARLQPGHRPKSPYLRVYAAATRLVNSGPGALRDPLVRQYLLTFVAHIPPDQQDDMSAAEIDDLLVFHGRYTQLVNEAQEKAPSKR